MYNQFDLHFTSDCVTALSVAGQEFIRTAPLTRDIKNFYSLAIGFDLQVSFDTSETRDRLAAIPAVL